MNLRLHHIRLSERLNDMTEYIIKDLVFNDEKFVFIGFSNKGFEKNENQDRFLIRHDNKSVNICVADGLGSSKMSHIGAEQAVKTMSDVLQNSIGLDQLSFTFKQAWKENFSNEINMYDTTIRFFQLTSESINYGGIGDGVTLIKHDDFYIKDHNNNSFTNQTESVNSPTYSQEFKKYSIPYYNLQAVMIATDGISEDIEEDQLENMLNIIINQILSDEDRFIKHMVQLIDSWPVKTNHDDKTVVFLVKRVVIKNE